MNTDIATRAAKTIATHWDAGTKLEQLSSELRPMTMQEGYRIQNLLGQTETLVGWKIAATSTNGQQHIGVDGPIAGRLFARRIIESGANARMFGNKMAAAECEFVFKLNSDLAPRKLPYSRDEVLNAVESLHPGLELPDSRFADFAAAGGPQLAADNACTHWMVIGEPTDAEWRSVDLSQHKTCLRVDGVIATQGTGADVLGDPRDALTWIANNTNAQGDFLRSGQYVTTGVTGLPFGIAAGQHVQADLGRFGAVDVHLID